MVGKRKGEWRDGGKLKRKGREGLKKEKGREDGKKEGVVRVGRRKGERDEEGGER